LNTFKIGETKTDELGNIETVPNSSFDSISKLLFQSLHTIDPRIKAEKSKLKLEPSFEFDKIGSKYEEDFLFRHIPQFIGEEWFQLLESQREFTSIVNFDSTFTRQRTDFTIEFPYKISDKHGIVIEIDGPHHWENQSQMILDEQRDTATANTGWLNTLRIQTRNFGNIQGQLTRLKELSKEHYFQILKQNFATPFYQNEIGLRTLQVVLSPFAIARLQKVLIHSIIQNKLNLQNKKWNIAVIERDVPCAALAIADLQQQLKNIFALKGENVFPEIELTVFVTPEFKSAEINRQDFKKHFSNINFIDVANSTSSIEFDLLLDISILQRKGFSGNEIFIAAKNKVVIRSSHHLTTKRHFLTSDVISYQKFVQYNSNNPDQSLFELKPIHTLRYFLQNIFRKYNFREGQIEILNKALQGESVIGLLPTGGGKSLTYQLAALFSETATLAGFTKYNAADYWGRTAIQFAHRGAAYLIVAIVVFFFLKARKIEGNKIFNAALKLLPATVLLQATIGIFTVINCVGSIPVGWGVLHQAGAMLLIANVAVLWFGLNRTGRLNITE